MQISKDHWISLEKKNNLLCSGLLLIALHCCAMLPAQSSYTGTFRSWNAALLNPDSVKHLIIKRVKLKDIESHISKFPNLTHIEFHHSRLTRIPEVICNLANLAILDLGNNNIDTVSDCICRLKNLEQLSLWDNNIYHLPDCLAELPRLRVIDLHGMDYNAKEQSWMRDRFPNIELRMAPPCNCNFD